MILGSLVGKLAVRCKETCNGGNLFLSEPVLVLSYTDAIALVCIVDETSMYDMGTTITLTGDYLDNAWADYGDLLSSACATKAQVITKMLNLLGIEADNESLIDLCKAVTFKSLLSQIESSLDLGDLLRIMGEDNHPTVQEQTPSESSWGSLRQGSAGFVKRGV